MDSAGRDLQTVLWATRMQNRMWPFGKGSHIHSVYCDQSPGAAMWREMALGSERQEMTRSVWGTTINPVSLGRGDSV